MGSILVMGYDKRTKQLYNQLVNANSKLYIDFLQPDCFDYEKIAGNDYDTIILPIPTKMVEGNILKDYNIKVDAIINNWKDAKFVYATINKNDAFDGVCGISLLEDEDFVLKNAYLTAKAVMEIVFKERKLKTDLCMVVGNGRIGKYLSNMLKDRDVQIILATKNYSNLQSDTKYKKCIDYTQIDRYLAECDIVFNTAPYNYFTYGQLNNYNGVYLELASKPYGFLYDGENLPKSVILCPSLPGKYYPKEAAKIIFDTIYDFVAKG